MVDTIVEEPGITQEAPSAETPNEEQGEPDEVAILRSKLEESERRRSGLDRETNLLRQQLAAVAAAGGNTKAMQERLDALELNQAKLLDAQGVTDDNGGTPLSHEQSLIAKRKSQQAADEERQRIEHNVRFTTAWETIVEDYQERGRSPDALREDGQFMSSWNAGQLKDARRRAMELLNITPRSTTKKAGEDEETEEQRVQRIAEEKSRQTLRERGLLKSETTGNRPKTTWTAGQIAAMSIEEYKKHKPEIDQAQREGRIT